MGKTDTNNLGQYFTPDNIAGYMASVVTSVVPPSGRVLDPCIGENVFFSFLDNQTMALQGLEIDKSLVTKKTNDFYDSAKRSLIIGDFVEQEFERKFDAVIMNPPYTRQEKVSPATKVRLKTIASDEGIALSAKANLYVYFILKGLALLKAEGVLVAITYDSWLYSSFGTDFKQYLIDNHNLKQIIHFKHDAFDGVDVGATLLIIQKSGTTTSTAYTAYESAKQFNTAPIASEIYDLSPQDLVEFNDHTTLKHKIEFESKYFVDLASLSACSPWRGASSPSNKHFLFKAFEKGLVPVLKKTPKDSYCVSLKNAIYALAVDAMNDLPETHLRLKHIEAVLTQSASDSLKNKMANDPYWYKFPLRRGGDIIFNYYFRDNPRFIFNEENISTMGNYYNISCPDKAYETFALLNSSLTRYAVNRNSKSQGKGLKKIQLYKFNKIPVLSLENFSRAELATLRRLGQSLVSGKNSTKEIDEIVLKKYSSLLDMDYTSTKLIIDTEINK